MRCSSCSHENRSGGRFCVRCGAALGAACPSCDAENDPDDRFCGSCGDPLPAPPTPASRGAVPEPDAPAPTGERRHLTVLFSDIVGSTGLSQQLDAEEWRELLAAYQQRAAAAVERWGGHVAQKLGDGLLVYFGWPTAREDDPQRAVRGGLAILDAVRELGDPRISVRVGMHTGTVVVADDGMVFGDTANVAARVQSAAEPDTVLVTAATQSLVAGLFVVEDRGAHALKGVRTPLQLYQVVRASGVRGRLDLAAGRLTPFVGREVELATLLERWERVQDADGQTVLIVGEAGVGKSRLVYQLRHRLSAAPHTWLECGASPYASATPFHPVVSLLSTGIGIAPEDTANDKLAKIDAALGATATDERVALIAILLGVSPPQPIPLSPEVQRRRTMELLAEWTLSLCAAQPLILVVEDLHWCDPSTVELLGCLNAQIPTARLLLLATSRPQLMPPWPTRDHVTTMPLAGLTRRQARAMVAMLAGRGLPAPTLDALIARADGVPLYVEELARSLVEPGAPKGIEAIPATLADSLMGRLDRMSSAKEVAQRAAVLGREFAYCLLVAVADLDEAALRHGLARLVEAEVLFVRGEPPHADYVFKHALVQEAAYGSLLRKTRQALHARVASVLEERSANDGAVIPEVLGRHHEAAGNFDRAIACYRAAGQRGVKAAAHAEAVRHFEKALALLATRPESPERDRDELAIRLLLNPCFAALRGWGAPEMSALFERAFDLARGADNSPAVCVAHLGLGMTAVTRGELARGYALGERALAIARLGQHEANAMYARLPMAISQFLQGHPVEALRLCDEVIALWDPARHRPLVGLYGEDAGMTARAWASLALWQRGQPDRARGLSEEALRLARDVGHPKPLGWALVVSTMLHWLRGDAEGLRVRSDETLEHAAASELAITLGFGRCFAAWCRVDLGEGADALLALRDGISALESTGAQVGMPFVLGLLAQACSRVGRIQEGLTTLESALAATERCGMHFWDAELHCTKGDLLLGLGGAHEKEAEDAWHHALELAHTVEAPAHELRAATRLARLWGDRSGAREARELLAPIYDRFTEGFDTGDLVTARRVLDGLERGHRAC